MDFTELARQRRPDVERMASAILRGHGGEAAKRDLVQAGLVGLWQASLKFIPGSLSLWDYAKSRVRGAMVDELRVMSSRSRTAQAAFTGETWPLRSPWAILFGVPIGSADHAPSPDNPEEVLLGKERADAVRKLLFRLPARQAEVLKRHYLEGASFKDLAVEAGVTESRACQVAGDGLRRLKDSITQREASDLCSEQPNTRARPSRHKIVGRTHAYEHAGKCQGLAAWARELGVPTGTLQARLDSGWSVRETLETPVRKKTSPGPDRGPEE